jgi:hypothetical protein
MSARFFTNKSKTLNDQNFNKILIIFSASQSLPWQAGNCPISRYRDQWVEITILSGRKTIF